MNKPLKWDYDIHGELIGAVCTEDNAPCQFEINQTCPYNCCCDTIDERILYYTDKGLIVEMFGNQAIVLDEILKERIIK